KSLSSTDASVNGNPAAIVSTLSTAEVIRLENMVPLSDLALKVLESQRRIIGHRHVFGRSDNGYSGWGHAKLTLDEVVKLEKAWTLHDLRRTVRTALGRLGVAPHVSEAVLNDLPPKLTRTYDVNKYEAEKADALNRWARHIELLLAKASGANVIEMARA